MEDVQCPKCSGYNNFTSRCADGSPHYAGLYCKDCHAWIQWLPKPKDDALEVPFWVFCDSDIVDIMKGMEDSEGRELYTDDQIKAVFADAEKLDKIRVKFEQGMDSQWRDVMEEAIEEVVG